ncbi:SMP-30/gluconolactonase/LRE family protein [Gordonia sp. DT219]|uniref:SMP-30/gluconolactonase/LRE family protein n=1 Tax=Gordonia sp. DT219 TaxID=3416658 RepID=UPI003CF11E30
MTIRIEPLTDVECVLGESPMWDPDAERLYWVDSFGRMIHHVRPDGSELGHVRVSANIGSMVLDTDGKAMAAMKTGIHRIDLDSGESERLHHPEKPRPANTLNDSKVDRAGRMWFGSIAGGDHADASLYRLDPDLSLHVLDGGIGISNGPCFAPDDATFYFSDSAAEAVYAYDFDVASGSLSNKREFRTAPAAGASVDGATVDAEDHYWCAHVYGSRIARYTPEGTRVLEIALPAAAVTSVMFGGPDLDILYVTSMKKPLSRPVAPGPLAGRLFAITGLGITGVAEPKFGCRG